MTTTELKTVTPHEAAAARDQHLFLDVRTPSEYAEIHIEGSRLHPLDELDPAKVREVLGDNKSCCIVCRSGNRAKQAAEKLTKAGLGQITVLDGGMQAWDAAGLPANRGQKKTISLERQVRIGAGVMVFAGTLLGVLVNPLWLILPGFVGAGLTFAGVTDWCGMGLLLARMPWNQNAAATSCKL